MTSEEWDEVFSTKANFIIDSDAHTPSRVGEISLIESLEKDGVKIPYERVFNVEDRKPKFRFEEFKKRL